MFTVSFGIVFLGLFLQNTSGKSLDLQYGYQEIEDPFSQTNQEEVKILEFDRISDDEIEEICKNLRVKIHVRESESVIDCLEPLFGRDRRVILMKRNAEDLEGSGDLDVPLATNIPEQKVEEGLTDAVKYKSENVSVPNVEIPPENQSKPEEQTSISSEKPEIPTDVDVPLAANIPEQKVEEELTDAVKNKTENLSVPNVDIPPENQSKPEEQKSISSEKPEIPTGNPGSFEGGFDNILKNIPRDQNSSQDIENADKILKTSVSKDQMSVKSDASIGGEEAKTGESQEEPTAASPNNILLIVIGALGVIGALAFVYNFVKSRRESQEIDEVVKLETEGKELKEMKPLMKSPLAQNGAKSMEYIDADPQIQVPTETRVEVNRDHNSE